jgi:DNA-binding PadR family transcriptional regulator
LVSPPKTRREGRRPERTVYALAEAGRVEFLTWLRELLRESIKEHAHSRPGSPFLRRSPNEAATLLEERVRLLEEEVGGTRHRVEGAAER